MVELTGHLYSNAGVARTAATAYAFATSVAATEATATDLATASDAISATGQWVFDALADNTYDIRIDDGSSIRWRRYAEEVQYVRAQLGFLHLTERTDTGGTPNSVQAAIFEGNRATPTDGDEFYLSLRLSDSAGNQDEFARLSVVGVDITTTTEDGRIDIDLLDAGTLREYFRLHTSHIEFTRGMALASVATGTLAALYSLGRNADATNLFQFNVPTNASFEFSVNDVAQMVVGASSLTGNVVGTGASQVAAGDHAHATLYANQALSNLASVAINLSLTSDTDITDDLGTAAIRWNALYGAILSTGDTATDTLILRARDVDGASWTTFATLTAANAPTMDLSTAVTMGGNALYYATGTDVPVTDGGTGASDAGTARTNLGVVAASLAAAGIVELATTAEINTGTDSTRAVPVDQYVASNRNVRYILYRAVAPATDCAVATTVGGDLRIPFTGTIVGVKCYVDTAGTTSTMTVDLNLTGTGTIMTTDKLDVLTTAKADDGTAALTTTAVTAGDIITVDIDAIHTTAAKGLTVRLDIRQT